MSKRKFTPEQINELLKNRYISKCSTKSITYSQEFKVLAVKKYDSGLTATQIFRDAGIDLVVVGKDIPDGRVRDWRKTYKSHGADKLRTESRGKSRGGGRPRTKGLTDSDKIRRLEVEVAYLKAENDFLAKLRAAKKR